jgi:hypothetical protein
MNAAVLTATEWTMARVLPHRRIPLPSPDPRLPHSRRPVRLVVPQRDRTSLCYLSPLLFVLAAVAFFGLLPIGACADEICIRNCFTTGTAGAPDLNGNASFAACRVESADGTSSAQVTMPVDGTPSHFDFALAWFLPGGGTGTYDSATISIYSSAANVANAGHGDVANYTYLPPAPGQQPVPLTPLPATDKNDFPVYGSSLWVTNATASDGQTVLKADTTYWVGVQLATDVPWNKGWFFLMECSQIGPLQTDAEGGGVGWSYTSDDPTKVKAGRVAMNVWVTPVNQPSTSPPLLSIDADMTISVTGATNQVYQLQAATDLQAASWQPLALLTNITGTVTFTESPATNAQRFYRAQVITQ